jgi:hypothetical protein
VLMDSHIKIDQTVKRAHYEGRKFHAWIHAMYVLSCFGQNPFPQSYDGRFLCRQEYSQVTSRVSWFVTVHNLSLVIPSIWTANIWRRDESVIIRAKWWNELSHWTAVDIFSTASSPKSRTGRTGSPFRRHWLCLSPFGQYFGHGWCLALCVLFSYLTFLISREWLLRRA